MRTYNCSIFLILAFVILPLIYGCKNDIKTHHILAKQNRLARTDSIIIMKTVLDSFFSEGFDDPVLFLIKNDVIKSNYNLTVLGKQVKYSPEPNDYYSKLIISFEQLTIADTISTVTVYSKRAGIIGNFVLKKKNGKWLIKSYNKIFT